MYILLKILVCIFLQVVPFWRAHRESLNTNNEWKYEVILHTKTSNKLFIKQILYFLLISHNAGKADREA